jgi:hypothetical protein
MAINYLNNVDLNRNELQDAQLIRSQVENQPNDAAVGGTPVEGQLYFNTSSDVLKVYANGAWVEVGGGVVSLTAGTYLTNSGTAADPVINHDATTRTDGATAETLAFGGTFTAYTDVTTNATGHVTDIEETTFTMPANPNVDTTYDLTGVGSTNGTAGVRLTETGTSNHDDVLIVGAGTTAVTRSGGTLTVTSNDQFDGTVTSVAATHAGNAFTASIGNVATVNPSVNITMNGASTDYIDGAGNLTAFPNIPQGDITGIDEGNYIQIDDSTGPVPTINALGTTAATASRLIARDGNGYGYVATPASGDSTTKIATTAFVQASLTGLLEFKSGFNAATGAIVSGGNLTSGAARVAVAVGDYYVVTVAGNFFGNAATPLTPGDSVIVQTAAAAGASTEADFIVVQSDTDLATLTTLGIGNVNAGDAIDVTYASGTATVSVEDSTPTNPGALTVAASSGTFYDGLIIESYANALAQIGLDIDGLANVNTTSSSSKVAVYDEATSKNKSMELENFFKLASSSISKTGTIAAGSLSGTVVHDFGINTIVQTIDNLGNTVYCDISRTATTSVATISATQATAITILVQKIG